jgi:hypothetical protein
MKKPIKIYITEADLNRLKLKARERGFENRGWLSNFLGMIAKEEMVLINQDTQNLLKMLKLKVGK